MGNQTTLIVPTVIGDLTLEIDGQSLLSLSISKVNSNKNSKRPLSAAQTNNHSVELAQQLEKYFSSATSFTNLRLAPQGTDFQKSVWNELSKIPCGQTLTYGEIAKKLNSSARAVGNACRKNPIAIIVPCHRVVSATGLGGYAGKTEGRQLNIKRWLLKHEGVLV